MYIMITNKVLLYPVKEVPWHDQHVRLAFLSFDNYKMKVVLEIKIGFTKHYRAADGGQPAVIRVRK
jgi:hypothetical protein